MDSRTEKARLEAVAERYHSQEDFDSRFQRFFGHVIGEQLRGKTCLELGTASGVMGEVLAQYAGAIDMVDGSTAYLEEAKRRVKAPSARFFHSLFESYEPDRKYDAVIASHVLEHVEDPVAILKRIRQWMQPHGVLYAFVPNAKSIHRQLGVAMGLLSNVYELSDRDRMLDHRRVYDPDTFAADIRRGGFDPGPVKGVLVKPFQNSMMENLPVPMIDGFLELGCRIPELAADIYYECKPA